MKRQSQQERLAEILIVDDITENLKLLAEVLTEAGYQVRPVTDGQLALRSIAIRPPDLILLDVKIPGMDGYEVCHLLKSEEKSRDIPVIFISALGESRDKVRGFAAGGVDYITKPFEATEVLARVATHLALRRLQADLKQHNLRLHQEIAERRQVEAALRQSEQTYRTVVETTGTALIIIEENMVISLANTRFAQLSGYSREEIEGTMSLTAFVAPEDMERIEKNHILRRIDPQAAPASYEFRVIDRHGTVITVVINVAMIPNTQKSVASLMDVSTLKKMEAELQRAHKWESISLFAGGIAHDFNNLLGIILGNINLVEMSVETPDTEVFKYLRGAERACLQSRDLTWRMIALTESMKPAKTTQSIRELVMEAVAKALRGTDIQGHYDVPGDLQPVRCDPVQIREMIVNVVVNAVEAMKPGGSISVSARNEWLTLHSGIPLAAGRYVHLMVRDHGKGIPPDILPHIFDPYFSTKQRGTQKGMGLGLTIAYVIVKKHHGDISLKSDVDAGTTVHIYLPASESGTDIPLEKTDGKNPNDSGIASLS